MKTAILFANGEEFELYVLDGDYRHLHEVWINEVADNAALQQELNLLLYSEDGYSRYQTVTVLEIEQAVRSGASLIICGMLI